MCVLSERQTNVTILILSCVLFHNNIGTKIFANEANLFKIQGVSYLWNGHQTCSSNVIIAAGLYKDIKETAFVPSSKIKNSRLQSLL